MAKIELSQPILIAGAVYSLLVLGLLVSNALDLPTAIELVLKVSSSIFFVILAYICFKELEQDKIFFGSMLIGMAIMILGDLVIQLDFKYSLEMAMIAFGVGHLCYIRAFVRYQGFSTFQFVVFFGLVITTLCTMILFDLDMGKFLPFAVIYTVIISFMVGSACSFLRDLESSKWFISCIVVGAILFFLSDVTLSINEFSNSSNWIGMLTNLLYYFGQGLIAISFLGLYSGRVSEKIVSEEEE